MTVLAEVNDFIKVCPFLSSSLVSLVFISRSVYVNYSFSSSTSTTWPFLKTDLTNKTGRLFRVCLIIISALGDFYSFNVLYHVVSFLMVRVSQLLPLSFTNCFASVVDGEVALKISP